MGLEISALAYARIIKAMFAIGCFAGLIKVLGGSASLLLADVLLLALVFALRPKPEADAVAFDGLFTKTALFLAAFLLGLGLCQSFNPNVPGPGTGLFYYRISTYPMLCIFIGYKMLRIPSMAPGVFNFVLGVCTPINALYALVQSFRLDPLSIQMVKHLGWGQYGALGTYRVTGFFQGPMQLGLLCAMGAGIFLTRNIFLEKWKLRGSIVFFILIISLIASMSRASLLGFLSFLILITVLLFKRLGIRGHLAAFVSHLAILSLIPITAIAIIGDLETVNVLIKRVETLGNVGQDNSFKEGRINNWKLKVMPTILESPWGRGTGSTGTARTGEPEPYTENIMETESLYFSLALELGWIGFVLSMVLFILPIVGMLLLIRNNSPPPGFDVSAIIWVFTIAGITSPNMSAFPVTWLYFFSIPFALAPLDAKLSGIAWNIPKRGLTS